MLPGIWHIGHTWHVRQTRHHEHGRGKMKGADGKGETRLVRNKGVRYKGVRYSKQNRNRIMTNIM